MILKRVMTRKSIVGYGASDVRDLSVQMLLDLGKQNFLINSYFNLEKIDFIEDILEELGITAEWRIPKPSKDLDKRIEFYKNRYKEMDYNERIKYFNDKESETKQKYARARVRSNRRFSADSLRLRNQGKF